MTHKSFQSTLLLLIAMLPAAHVRAKPIPDIPTNVSAAKPPVEQQPSATPSPQISSKPAIDVTDTAAEVIAPAINLKDIVPLSKTVSDPATSPQPTIAKKVSNTHKNPTEQEDIKDHTKDIAATNAALAAQSLTLLGKEVMPGTAARLAWDSIDNITELSSPTPVLVVNGIEPGPNLCLTAAIHGDELNGIEIVRRVMYDLDPMQLHGRIIGVPVVNLLGFQRGSRYLPDRRDLNRFFPGDDGGSLAARIAYSFYHQVIRNCDMLIDLHTGSLRRTNLLQLRADMTQPHVVEMVKQFDDTVVVHSPGSIGMLRTAANLDQIAAITLEVGESLRIQEKQINAGVNAVNAFMDRRGLYPRLFTWGEAQPAYFDSQWIRAESGGILSSNAKLGDFIQYGSKLGKITNPITNQVSEIKSPFSGRVIGMAVDQVVMPGFAAYHIGIRATEETLIEKGTEQNAAHVPQPDDEKPE